MAHTLSVSFMDDSKLALISDAYPAHIHQFIDTLPDRRWNKNINAFTCSATPATAWRIVSYSPAEEINPTEKVRELARRFSESCFEAARRRADSKRQPEFRQFDSWKHQLAGYHFANALDACLLNMHMGTGKSKVAVDLVINRNAKRTLILCPLSVLGVWNREFEKFAGIPVNPLILNKPSWTSARKRKEAEKYLERCEMNNEPAVIVVNYDTAKAKGFESLALKTQWDVTILDESHKIKSANSAVSKFAAKLATVSKFRLCLTGTPMPHSPLDLFGQFRFLDRGLFGTSWVNFRSRYAVTHPQFKSQVLKFTNQDELAETMALITYEVDQSVLDLPDVIHTEINGDMDTKTKAAYNELKDEMITFLDSGETLTVSNTLSKILRLQQITSGYCVDENDDLVLLGNEKIKLLEELLSDLPQTEPVVVFCRFKQDLKNIRELAEKTGRRYGEISGDQKDLTPQSTMPENIDLMGVQISAGGVGIDLTRAAYGVYYSVGYSLGDFEQSVARQHRPGQERTTFFYHLTLNDSIDRVIYKALDKRRELVDAVIDHLRVYQGETVGQEV